MKIDYSLEPRQLKAKIDRLWDASADKIRSLEAAYEPARGTPVFTVRGVYTSRRWTEWTQGCQFGSAL
ncbi:MAG: glycosyl hydrolase, partial [Acidobacteriota bacterium]